MAAVPLGECHADPAPRAKRPAEFRIETGPGMCAPRCGHVRELLFQKHANFAAQRFRFAREMVRREIELAHSPTLLPLGTIALDLRTAQAQSPMLENIRERGAALV